MKYPQPLSMPAAISDWLEAELDSRGIDSELYTRYIISLLESDVIDDVIDLGSPQSRIKKGARASLSGSRPFRNTSEWWPRYSDTCADQLKRAAAVKCLISASVTAADQTSEIESLVDELSKKLKEVRSEQKPINKEGDTEGKYKILSPQELAREYYAAFPPLDPNSKTPALFKNKNIPQWAPRKHKLTDRKPAPVTMKKQHYNPKKPKSLRANTINKKERHFTNTTHKNKQPLKDQVVMETSANIDDVAITNDDELFMYDNLIIGDIIDLLDESPTQNDFKNVKNNTQNKCGQFLACGTNITNSIWSQIDENMNHNLTFNQQQPSNDLGLQFSFINLNNNWSDTEFKAKMNELDNKIKIGGEFNFDAKMAGDFHFGNKMAALGNHMIQGNKIPTSLDVFEEQYAPFGKSASLESSYAFNVAPGANLDMATGSDNSKTALIELSLQKINHNNSTSGFSKVVHPKEHYNLFTTSCDKFKPLRSHFNANGGAQLPVLDNDDLLTSYRSHFQPIQVVESQTNKKPGQYTNGSTFVVCSQLNKVNYKQDGDFLLVEHEGKCKKYKRFKNDNFCDDFDIKFCVNQNDKSCQTDFSDLQQAFDSSERNLTSLQQEEMFTCDDLMDFNDSGSDLSEITWKYNNNNNSKCLNCSKNWNIEKNHVLSEKTDMRNIWQSGEQTCQTCQSSGSHEAAHKLREDITQDGEQLLSDLSSIQRDFMSDSNPIQFSDFLTKETLATPHSWSFASRLQENCLIQMSTIPTLRSVTL